MTPALLFEPWACIYTYTLQVAVFTILASLIVVVTVIGAAWWLMWKVTNSYLC